MSALGGVALFVVFVVFVLIAFAQITLDCIPDQSDAMGHLPQRLPIKEKT